jgi:hypothetical protein
LSRRICSASYAATFNGDDLFLIAEEYCKKEGSNRRIDLLFFVRDSSLVVVEIKRTEDGGHMELQAA